MENMMFDKQSRFVGQKNYPPKGNTLLFGGFYFVNILMERQHSSGGVFFIKNKFVITVPSSGSFVYEDAGRKAGRKKRKTTWTINGLQKMRRNKNDKRR